MRHQEDKRSKATNPLFSIKTIAKLEWSQSNAQQNIEQLEHIRWRAIANPHALKDI